MRTRLYTLPLLAMGGLLLSVYFLAPPPLAGQADVKLDPRSRAEDLSDVPRPDIRTDAQMVLIPVSVNDPLGRPVSGLSKKNFEVTDNGEAQSISAFFRDDEPIALALVLDISGSMKGLLPQARRAATYFITSANDGDQFTLVEFSTEPEVSVPLTNDLEHVRYELLFNDSDGETALIDAVYLGITELQKSALRRKAMIVVSDGGDNNSRYTLPELRDIVREANVLIYSVGIHSDQTNIALLRSFSEDTGGRTFDTIMGMGGLQDIAQKIAVDLRNRYMLGYVPTDRARDGLYHKVELTLKVPRGLPRLTTYWRKGYYAPTE